MADQLTTYQNTADSLGSRLDNSPTAYAPNTLPSKSDVSIDSSLTKANTAIDALKSKQLRNQWYGPTVANSATDPNTEVDTSGGFLMSALKNLSRPMNAIAGTVQYALGKGAKPNLVDNVNNAMNTGLDYGNILTQFGVPRGVQVPLGFALDVAFDPVNWLTMGGGTLVGGAAKGLVKGFAEGGTESGIRGALDATGTSLASNLSRKASTVMNLMPFSRKIGDAPLAVAADGTKLSAWDSTKNLVKQGLSKYNNATDALSRNAIAGTDKFNAITNTNLADELNKGIFGQPSGIMGNYVENKVRSMPSYNIFGHATPTGDQIATFFKYSPADASKISEQYDLVHKLSRSKDLILVDDLAKGVHFMDVNDVFKPGATFTVSNVVKQGVDSALEEANKVISVENTDRKIRVYNSLDNAKALINIAAEDTNFKHITSLVDLPTLEKAYKVTAVGKTGFEWYDNALSSLKDLKIGDMIPGSTKTVGEIHNDAGDLVKTFNSYTGIQDLKPLEKLLNGYQDFLTWFKPAKVMMNPGSHVVAWLGNFSMGGMMGIPVYRLKYIEEMVKARQLVSGKMTATGFKEMFFNDLNRLIQLADDNPTVFRDVTGINASQISNKLKLEDLLVSKFNERESGSTIVSYLSKKIDDLSRGIEHGEKLSSYEGTINQAAKLESQSNDFAKSSKDELGTFPLPSKELLPKIESGLLKRADEYTGITAGEYTPNQNVLFNQLKASVAKDAETAPAYRIDIHALNALINSMPAQYEHIDQIWKISTVSYLSKIGVSASELKVITRTVPIDTTKDLLLDAKGNFVTTVENGEKLYRTTPLYASRVATEAFMNYAAMPDFVRMMRAIPFGAPFVSFPYAMAIKTAKATINNPALFNKVGFMINEMNAARTPEEKNAMQQTYNQYLQSPTVVKMMGMWNTDVKNMIPFYQINMLNPSERNYTGNSFQAQMMKLSDQFPILNDPFGAVLKDYLLQPWLLAGTGEVSSGAFGQPIVPNYDINGKQITPSMGTRLGYATRALAESVVPGALSYTGIPIGWTGISPEMTNLIPSYPVRSLVNATQGRSSIGASAKEDAVRRTFATFLSRTGLPAYPLNLTTTGAQSGQ